MQLLETVKGFLKPKEIKNPSSEVKRRDTLMDLSDDTAISRFNSFFDVKEDENNLVETRKYDLQSIIEKQKDYIQKYRLMAMKPEVSGAVDEIINEVIYNYNDPTLMKLQINEENEKIVKAISERWERLMTIGNIQKNGFYIMRNIYIDGQGFMHLTYDEKNMKAGIQGLKLIDPRYLYFNREDKVYQYSQRNGFGTLYAYDRDKDLRYSPEEIVRMDFGLYDNNIVLSYLEYAFKVSNILQTLEDLLIPLRFSRSISRRIFNIDVGDLPTKRAEELMRQYQNKFKYKKFYNNDTGEVSNQQHITSMVEDYWFANRNGSRGTEVTTLNESENLGELDDILYFYKKLYKALNIPSNRIDINIDADKGFNYDDTQTTLEELKFYAFICRLRQCYTEFFKEILRRDVIACGIMSDSDWEERSPDINIVFANENLYIEKMRLDNFTNKVEVFKNMMELFGKAFTVKFIFKKVFNMSDAEVDDMMDAIEKEQKDPKMQNFYEKDENSY